MAQYKEGFQGSKNAIVLLDDEVKSRKGNEKITDKLIKDKFNNPAITVVHNQDEFKCVGLELPEQKIFRWTIDYEEDYEFVKKIYFLLYPKNKIFLMKDIMTILKKYPEIGKINSMHVKESSYLKYKNEVNDKSILS